MMFFAFLVERQLRSTYMAERCSSYRTWDGS